MEIDKREKVIVTGANGFIGRNLCFFLKEKGYFVRGAVRNNTCDILGTDECIQVGEINELTDWQQALAGMDTVIHLAARVHIKSDSHKGRDSHFFSVEAFRKVNVLGTERLARMAAKVGVKRFIFISSVKVNGEGFRDCFGASRLAMTQKPTGLSMTESECHLQLPYSEKDVPAPQDAYGISKMEAEQVLASVAADTGLQVVILRLPLVYGPGVKANFKNLIKIASDSLPLPFQGINNQRSFLYLGNLVDAINTCINHPLAAGEIFLVSDGQDISTPDLIKMIACAMRTIKGDSHKRRDSHLFYLHPGILKALCRIMGKAEELEKLTGTLIVDSSKIRNLLDWKPPFTLKEGIEMTVKGTKIASPSTFGGKARNDTSWAALRVSQFRNIAKRVFDLILALILIVLLSIPMLVIIVLIKLMSKGPVIFWTDRVGLNNSIFKMAKFRTMKINTPQLATHLMKNPETYLTSVGAFLRRYSLDEIPQLFNILKGDMSFVGPRPALFNQDDLVALRTQKNIHTLIPGITGWAQVNGRDDLSIPVKVSFDEYYFLHRSFLFDLYIILLTALKVIKKEGIQH